MNNFNSDLLAGKHRLHFIGIGGSGMYPLVQILAARGYEISGSDVNEGSILDAERAMGIQVYMGQRAENVAGADLVIYSAAIHPDNPELAAAVQQGIPTAERSVLLGYVAQQNHRHRDDDAGVRDGGQRSRGGDRRQAASDRRLRQKREGPRDHH